MINHIKGILLIICVFTSHMIISAQETIDIDQAWIMMENSNTALRTLNIDQAAALRKVENLSHLIPGINLSVNLSRSSPLISNFTDPSNQGMNEADNWSLRSGLDLRLNLKSTVSIENQIQALELSLILLQREKKIIEIKTDLQKLFYQIDAGEKTINLQERIVNLTKNRLEQIEAQYNKGLRSELELLSAQIALSRDQPSLKKAKVDQEKRFITLRNYLGMDQNQAIEIIPLNILDLKNNIDFKGQLSGVRDNIEIRTLRLQLEIAQLSRHLSGRNLRSPTFGISLGWSTSFNPLFNIDTWTKDPWEDSIGLGFSLSVPIDTWFKGSDDQQSLMRLDDVVKKLELSMEDSIRKMNDQVSSLLLDLELSESNINVNKLNIELQEKTFAKVRQNYENGRTSLLDLDNSRQELQKALVTLEEEQLKMNLLFIDLINIAGD